MDHDNAPCAPTDSALLPMSKVVARSGVSASALRFYERRGLIVAQRDAAGRRVYRRHVLRRLAVIRAGQIVGLSLTDLASALAAIPQDRPPSREEWESLASTWRDDLDRRVAALLQLRDGVAGCIGCGCLSLATCPLANPDDVQGSDGPGPREWDAVRAVEQSGVTHPPAQGAP